MKHFEHGRTARARAYVTPLPQTTRDARHHNLLNPAQTTRCGAAPCRTGSAIDVAS